MWCCEFRNYQENNNWKALLPNLYTGQPRCSSFSDFMASRIVVHSWLYIILVKHLSCVVPQQGCMRFFPCDWPRKAAPAATTKCLFATVACYIMCHTFSFNIVLRFFGCDISHWKKLAYKALGMIYINMGSVMQLNMLHCILFFTGKYTAWHRRSNCGGKRTAKFEIFDEGWLCNVSGRNGKKLWAILSCLCHL